MDQEQSTSSSWRRWKREGVVILATAASITLSLWLKRTVERLIAGRIVDKNIVSQGIGGVPVTANQTNQSQYFTQKNAPGPMEWRGGRWEPKRSGVVSVSVDGREVHVRYSRSLEVEGYTLYQHDEILRADHLTSCPLLRARTSCTDCNWFMNDGVYWRNPICIAKEKIDDHSDDGLTMTSLRHMYEQSL